MIRSYDFDGTLRSYDQKDIKRTHDLLKEQIKSGDVIYVISNRNEDKHAGIDGEGVRKYVEMNFGKIGVYLTAGKGKYKEVIKLEIEKHYDDDIVDLLEIKKKTRAAVEYVGDDHSKERAEEIEVPDLKKLSVIVSDYGLHVDLARRLSIDFGSVYYYNPSDADYPTRNITKIGEGFEEIELVKDFFACKNGDMGYKKPDLFVFPCISEKAIGLQHDLIEQGKLVWGSREGAAMELYRWEFLEYQKSIGMPIPPSVLVVGIDALRKELYKRKDIAFVKIDATERGDTETFCHINEEITEITELLPMEHRLGKEAKTKRFIVQDPIPTTKEIGYDGFTIDGQFPNLALWGIEVKDKAYIQQRRDYKDIPEGVRWVNDKLSPALKGYGYRGDIATEIREGKDGKHYLIDMTCRKPYPPTAIMLENWKNQALCMYLGAMGIMVEPEYEFEFGCEVIMYSDAAKSDDYTLFMPKELEKWVKMPYTCFADGRRWVVPQASENACVGSLICLGNSAEEVIKSAEERSKLITGHSLKIDVHCLDSAIKELLDL